MHIPEMRFRWWPEVETDCSRVGWRPLDSEFAHYSVSIRFLRYATSSRYVSRFPIALREKFIVFFRTAMGLFDK